MLSGFGNAIFTHRQLLILGTCVPHVVDWFICHLTFGTRGLFRGAICSWNTLQRILLASPYLHFIPLVSHTGLILFVAEANVFSMEVSKIGRD